jgi:hypothetical protein
MVHQVHAVQRNKEQAEQEEMNEPSFATQHGRQVQDEPELIELAPGETSLDFLQRVYRSVKQPMSRRLRAAIEALQHEHPRLGAVAIGSMNGQDFASLLERAIARSNKEREVKQIEGRAI